MERKVVLFIATSLDGFIADNDGGVAWLSGEEENYQGDFGYGEFIAQVDTIIMGMTTYNQVVTELSPDKWAYEGLKTYVMTHQEIEKNEKAEFFKGDLEELVNTLKDEDGKNIWICGGASIVNQLIKFDLIDEYHITIMPIILGGGVRLFGKTNPVQKLHLSQVRSENGVVDVVYTRRAK